MFCDTCIQKRCIKIGKPCRKVEKLLPKVSSGKISSGEISVNPLGMDKIDFGPRCGTRTKPIKYDDNYELEKEVI